MQIAPDYEGIELGIGEGMLKKAIAQATGVNVNHINAEYKKAGDLGLVAMVRVLRRDLSVCSELTLTTTELSSYSIHPIQA